MPALSSPAVSVQRSTIIAFGTERCWPEFLAIKLALEEWRHWLEGTEHPFLTDHCNLEYLQTAKPLNSRQAKWSLLFDRLHFTLSYRLGTKSHKAVAFYGSSNLTRTPSPQTSSCPSLPVSTMSLLVLREKAQRNALAPSPCPTNRMYVPDQLRSKVLQFCHSCHLACHPGAAPHPVSGETDALVAHSICQFQRVYCCMPRLCPAAVT